MCYCASTTAFEKTKKKDLSFYPVINPAAFLKGSKILDKIFNGLLTQYLKVKCLLSLLLLLSSKLSVRFPFFN